MDVAAVTVDLFPATADLPDGRHRAARLVVADGRVMLFEAGASGPRLVASGTVADIAAQDGDIQRVTLEDGTVWVGRPAGGCGCGHRLKRTPLADLLALADP